MDGVEIIQKIRSWSNMPIIVISARTEDSDKIGALDAGADDYLTKPFSVDELLARLRVTQRRLALIKADTAKETPIFTNGALKIDYAAGCAYLDGAELHLTPIEYKLLCLLSKNVGKVLTHTYITQQICPVGACIGPRGARVAKIVDELGGEKIDIVRWSEDPAAFISEALSPAKVVDVELLEGENRAARVRSLSGDRDPETI